MKDDDVSRTNSEKCKNWFHGTCVSLSKKMQLSDKITKISCGYVTANQTQTSSLAMQNCYAL